MVNKTKNKAQKNLYLLDNCLLSKAVQRFELKDMFDIIEDFKSFDDFILKMQKDPCDVVLMNLDYFQNSELKELKKKFPDTSVIVHTSRKSEQVMLASFKNGASSYLFKDGDIDYKKTVKNVLKQGYSIDLKTLKTVFSKLPEPKIKNKKLKLTKRELEILTLIAKGFSNPEIANDLGVTINTIKTQVKHILSKLNAKDRAQAAVFAVKLNLIEV